MKSVLIRIFFLLPTLSYSEWKRRDNPYFSVFSPNAGKYVPEKTPYLDTFHAVSPIQDGKITFFAYFFGSVSCWSSGSSCGNKSYCSIICFHNQVSCFNDINTMVVQIKYAISSTYLNILFFITHLNATTKNG